MTYYILSSRIHFQNFRHSRPPRVIFCKEEEEEKNERKEKKDKKKKENRNIIVEKEDVELKDC